MRVILVPVANRPECSRALDAAFQLGVRLGSDIVGCHIRPHRESAVRMPMPLNTTRSDWQMATKGWNSGKLSRDAEALFSARAERAGYSLAKRPRASGERVAIWQERVGSPDKLLPIIGPTADLLVLSRPKLKGGRLASLFLLESLLQSCRPVLVLPQTRIKTVAQRPLIAWNQSQEVSRAVAMSMPLLVAAKSVHVAVAGREGGAGPKAAQLARYLAHHGVDAQILKGKGRNVTREIELAYGRANADLVLMGAYSRNRFREMMFGGLTEHMLWRSKLPALLYHNG